MNSINAAPCSKHLRWSSQGKQYRQGYQENTWAGAERVKREVELSYEMVGKPAAKPKTRRLWSSQAIDTFIRDKQGQNLNHAVLDAPRELGRLRDFCEQRGKFYIARSWLRPI